MDRPPTNSPPIPEADFATQIGVSRPELKKIRAAKLVPAIDWLARPENGAILLTDSGQKKIRAALELPPEPIEPSLATLALGWPQLRLATLTVTRLTPNVQILFCTNAGIAVRLRVRRNTLFVPGMQVAACKHVQADYYEYSGRLPRRKGRWN